MEEDKVSIAGPIVIGLIIIFGIFFIYTTSKVNQLEILTRDKGAEIDSSIWDRSFRLSKLVEILEKKGIEHEIDAPDMNSFGLGSSATIQAARSEQLDRADKALRKIIKEHPELNEDEDFKTNIEKFNTARQQLFTQSLAYNKSTYTYNNYISGFPANVIATFYKKTDRPIFGYVFADIDDEDI